MIAVCKDCTKRKVGCHSNCALYKQEKKIHDAERKNRQQEILSEIYSRSH